ncbi:hypothetical protein JXJ21_11475 [candidate division KSB1 bacterium]|nr:hypothetical protein [candidate division KSB1 bacterium]
MNNIFLIGSAHVGKSTIVQNTVSQLASIRIGGFFTEPIFERQSHIGYQIRSVSNRKMVFAHEKFRGAYRVGRFGILPDAFEKIGVAALAHALDTCQLIVMDEIGLMERGALQFQKQIIRCLESEIPVLGVMQRKAFNWWKSLLNPDDLGLIAVSESNRDNLPQKILPDILKILHK